MDEPSPELEAYFELTKQIYLRLEAEGRWDEVLATLRKNKTPPPDETKEEKL